MALYNLMDHLGYISRRSDSKMQRAAKKFGGLLRNYSNGKVCKLVATNSEFDNDTKVIIMDENKLEIASFKKYDQPLFGHEVTIDLDIEVIPYSRIQKVLKSYYKPGLTEELLLFAASICLDNEELISITPIKTPDESTPETLLSDLTNNGPFQKYLTEFITELEEKI
ncbi:hypothetical protein [Priestia megaterium]|uniref:hypothetical protein n=1 Tax=Priestia megaterium TaxID=1404 RepID=UPI002E1F091F|nr:hypothetical protein [Priestia megaterium]